MLLTYVIIYALFPFIKNTFISFSCPSPMEYTIHKYSPDKNASNWRTERKIIPLALIEHSECLECGSKNITTENIEDINTNEGIDILVSFRCKNCDNTKFQIREFQSLWNKTESIKLSPDKIEIVKDNLDEINQSFID